MRFTTLLILIPLAGVFAVWMRLESAAFERRTAPDAGSRSRNNRH